MNQFGGYGNTWQGFSGTPGKSRWGFEMNQMPWRRHRGNGFNQPSAQFSAGIDPLPSRGTPSLISRGASMSELKYGIGGDPRLRMALQQMSQGMGPGSSRPLMYGRGPRLTRGGVMDPLAGGPMGSTGGGMGVLGGGLRSGVGGRLGRFGGMGGGLGGPMDPRAGRATGNFGGRLGGGSLMGGVGRINRFAGLGAMGNPMQGNGGPGTDPRRDPLASLRGGPSRQQGDPEAEDKKEKKEKK